MFVFFVGTIAMTILKLIFGWEMSTVEFLILSALLGICIHREVMGNGHR